MEQLRLWSGLPPQPIRATSSPMRRLGPPVDPDAPLHRGGDVIPLWLARQRRGVKSTTEAATFDRTIA